MHDGCVARLTKAASKSAGARKNLHRRRLAMIDPAVVVVVLGFLGAGGHVVASAGILQPPHLGVVTSSSSSSPSSL
ncbi:hypothetical protein GUJ93_ZPchr0002g24413 [Zizania palustris]|uniref:Uncharacterized protein n=1 Tax=Zizania palustris TaxID=103762 RepID=A0A8J5REY3_ZIZPA|nr:hypothetical protein GUJ93_ZPchr0002g24413 [Zizania palustris]